MAGERRRDERARIFTIGAAYGFVAGVFAMALLVWQYGDLVDTRAAARLSEKPVVAREADDDPHIDAPRIETPAPAATTGSVPTIGPPLGSELKDRDLEMPVEGVRPGDAHLVHSVPADQIGMAHEIMRGRGARFGLATSESSCHAAHLAAV